MDRARLPLRRVNTEPVEPTFRWLARMAGFLLRRVVKLEWLPGGSLPQRGGLIIVANHTSNFDPVVLGHFIVWHGRWPRFLSKAELWRVPVIGWLVRACGQIPVERDTHRATDALSSAKQALAAGRCVVIYPEGTITGDPEGWPMTARRGAARLALESGCPVVPIAQWGAHRVMGFHEIKFPRLIPRKTISMKIGDPFPGREPVVAPDLAEAAALTDAFMVRLTALVAELRGEEPPPHRLDIRTGSRVAQPAIPT